MNKGLLIALGVGGFMFFQKENQTSSSNNNDNDNGGGSFEPPEEPWFDVPVYGYTPEMMLPTLGYVYFEEIQGWVNSDALTAKGWTLQNGTWMPPRNGTADILSFASGILNMVSGAATNQANSQNRIVF